MNTTEVHLFASYEQLASLYEFINTVEPIQPATKMCNFEFELLLPDRRSVSDFILTAEFWNDQAHSIFFKKADDSEIDTDEVQYFLNQNSAGATWDSRSDQPEFIFRSDNKAVASLDADRKSFSILGRDLLALRATQSKRSSADTSPPRIGRYVIGQLISEHPDASRFSWLDNFCEKQKIPGEALYRAPDGTDFLGSAWRIILGVIQNRIYKISARWSSKTEPPMEAMLVEVINYCRRQFGTNMTGNEHDAALWQTSFGKVTVNAKSVNTGGGRGIYVVIFEMVATVNVGGGFRHANN